jgi:hypothetical protein
MTSTAIRIVSLCAVAGLLAGADIYKWVDEDGVVHYTDKQPEDRQSAEIRITPPPVIPAPADAAAESAAADDTGQAWYEQWLAQQRERKALEKEQRETGLANRRDQETHWLELCANARQRHELLGLQCPVFFDGQGVLRARCPNQATWYYEGQLRYLSDAERADLLSFYEAQLADCAELGF